MASRDQSKGILPGLRLVSILTVASRITGLARDALMAAIFGTGPILDAFTVAFRIPNVFRRLFGEGALTAALLPSFVQTDAEHGRDTANAMAAGVGRRILAILTVSTLAIEGVLLLLRLFGDLSASNQLLCELTMLMLPYAVLICLAAVYSATLNAVHHFVVPALIPIALNLAWLAGGITAVTLVTDGAMQIRMIAVCIVVGGCLQLWIARFQAARSGIHFARSTDATVASEAAFQVQSVFKSMLPVLLGLSVAQINNLMDSVLAWVLVPTSASGGTWIPEPFQLREGTASALYLGQRLFQFPLGVFGVALGTVLFPRFARHAQAGARSLLNRDLLHGLQLVAMVGIPASLGLMTLSEPLADVLFRYGRFDADDAQLTAGMIAAHGATVWVFCGLLIVNRVFYATGQHAVPVRLGLICVASNFVLNLMFIPLCSGIALPLASGAATLGQLILAVVILGRQGVAINWRALLAVLWRCLLASLAMFAAVTATLDAAATVKPHVNEGLFRLINVVSPVTVAIIVYAMCLVLTRMSPMQLLRTPFGLSKTEDE